MNKAQESERKALAEWANTPHATLGFSERQLQVQAVLAELERLREDAGLALSYLVRGHIEEAERTLRRALRALASPDTAKDNDA